MTAARIVPTLLAALLSTALATGPAPIPVPTVTTTVADTGFAPHAQTMGLRDHMASDADAVVIDCPTWAIIEDAWFPHAPACYRIDSSLSIAKSRTEMYVMRYDDVEFYGPWYEGGDGTDLSRGLRTTWDGRTWSVFIFTLDTRSMLVIVQEYVD